MKKSLIFMGMLSIGFAYAQEERVGINTENPSATLNVKTKTDATSPKNLELENQESAKLLTVLNTGKVGINQPNPLAILDVKAQNDTHRILNLYNNTSKRVITVLNNGNTGIHTDHPTVSLEIIANKDTSTESQKQRGKIDAILFDTYLNTVEDPITKERRVSISGGLKSFGWSDYRSHSIDFGMNNISYSAKPFLAFSIADVPEITTDPHSDYTVEHMRITHKGLIGIGTTSPSHKLHIKADANPLKLEGVQTGTGEALVIDANGVVKKGTVAATEASKVASANALQCNAENRGKMNFVPNDNGSDVFGICLRNKDGNYYWGYMVGGNNPTNGTGAFGSGL